MSARRPRSSRTSRAAIALVLGALVGVAIPLASATAGSAPVATRIVVTSFGTDGVTVPNTGGAPDAYIVKGAPFAMSLCFVGPGGGVTDYTHSGTPVPCTAANGALPLSYNKDVVLSLTTTGLHAGSWKVTVPKAVSNATFSGTFTAAVNDTSIDLSNDARKAEELVTGSTGIFDVLIASATAQQSGLTGIGGGGAKNTACTATPDEQVCADLLLPAGVATGDGLVSLGVCDANCSSQLVQVLIALNGGINANPATLIVKCDKTLCGGGAIRNVPLYVTLGADEAPSTTAPACPSKGAVGTGQKFCVDYVQSTRDNAGDTILYLLFVEDLKVRFP